MQVSEQLSPGMQGAPHAGHGEVSSIDQASIRGDAEGGGRLGMSLGVLSFTASTGLPNNGTSEGVQLSSTSGPWSKRPTGHAQH